MLKSLNINLGVATIVTWLAVTISSTILLQDSPLFWDSLLGQLVILVLFIMLNWLASKDDSARGTLVLWLLLPVIFLLTWRVKIDFFFIYTIIWIATAPTFVSSRQSWLWLIIISAVWYFLRLVVLQQNLPFVLTLLVATFHLFALLSAMTARDSRRANENTQKVNRELLATQHLLEQASRENERTRIAREIHDLLGHHLTALTINLQVAAHKTEGDAHEKVLHCHALAKLLLSDVRDAVGTLREMTPIDLRTLIEISIRDIPRMEITLDMADSVRLKSVNYAEGLLRCLQEAITNSLKHTQANKAKISVQLADTGIVIIYEDNGGGCTGYSKGNGLTGIVERLAELGGALHIEAQPNMQLTISLPSVQ